MGRNGLGNHCSRRFAPGLGAVIQAVPAGINAVWEFPIICLVECFNISASFEVIGVSLQFRLESFKLFVCSQTRVGRQVRINFIRIDRHLVCPH